MKMQTIGIANILLIWQLHSFAIPFPQGLGLGLQNMMQRRSWFLINILFKVILVLGNINIRLVHGLNCSQYKRANTALYGFSRNCSSFSLAGDNKLQDYVPSGNRVDFNITTLVHECFGYACLQQYPACSLKCPCCKPYLGADPGFHASIWAPNNETEIYRRNLDCVIPTYLPVYTGFYFFSCNFSGYGMANTSKLVQMQLTWDTMIKIFPPLTFGVYITAGTALQPSADSVFLFCC